METITGTLSDIRFSKNGFLIGSLDTGEAVLGNLSEPTIGQEYQLSGTWVDDPKWGRQFKFDRYQPLLPQSADGIFLYLVQTARWVGPAIGRQIIKTFGDDTLTILKEDPQRVADAIKGLTLERAQEISSNLIANEGREAASVALESMLGGHHLPKSTITILVEKYGSDAPARVHTNPYSLMECRGIGFKSADRVAMALGYDREGIERRVAASLHALEESANTWGHTWLPGERFVEAVMELIGLPPSSEVRMKLLEDESIRIREDMVALSKFADDELEVAGAIRLLLEKGEDLSQ